MELFRSADTLEVLGVLVGVFLVLAGLGTVAGTPWETARGTAAAALRVLGALVAAVLGLALIWIVRRE